MYPDGWVADVKFAVEQPTNVTTASAACAVVKDTEAEPVLPTNAPNALASIGELAVKTPLMS